MCRCIVLICPQFDGENVDTIVNLGDHRRFMFDRMSCMEDSEENAEQLITAVEMMEPMESTESSNISLVSTYMSK